MTITIPRRQFDEFYMQLSGIGIYAARTERNPAYITQPWMLIDETPENVTLRKIEGFEC